MTTPKDPTTNNIFVKCVNHTSWESTPLKPWFDQPFVKYPEASNYDSKRFEDQFLKLFSVKPPGFMNIAVDSTKDIENIKYFKNHLNPSADVPSPPFTQRGVYLGKEGDFHGTTVPGVFDRLYIDDNESEMEEDLFFPFALKQADEKKIKGVCGLYRTDARGNESMVTSNGMDVSATLKKTATTKDAFDNNANFLDVRIPSIFIATSYDSKGWNRVKKVGKDDSFIAGYYLLHPDAYTDKMVTFNPIVFSMLFRVPYVQDPFLISKNVEEPNKTVLFNTSIVYQILHGSMINQMGNYSMDMHYNLLTKIKNEDVGFLEFRNPLLKHSRKKLDAANSSFMVPLNEFDNAVAEYQQLFNFLLLYLIYATKSNPEYKQYARFNSEYDVAFEFISFFTSTINGTDDYTTPNLLWDIIGLLEKFKKANAYPDNVPGLIPLMINIKTHIEQLIIHFPYGKIFTSYIFKDNVYILTTSDLLTVYLVAQFFHNLIIEGTSVSEELVINDMRRNAIAFETRLMAADDTEDTPMPSVSSSSSIILDGKLEFNKKYKNEAIHKEQMEVYERDILAVEKQIKKFVKGVAKKRAVYRSIKKKYNDEKKTTNVMKVRYVGGKNDIGFKEYRIWKRTKNGKIEKGEGQLIMSRRSVDSSGASNTVIEPLEYTNLINYFEEMKNIKNNIKDEFKNDDTLKPLLDRLDFLYMDLILFDKTYEVEHTIDDLLREIRMGLRKERFVAGGYGYSEEIKNQYKSEVNEKKIEIDNMIRSAKDRMKISSPIGAPLEGDYSSEDDELAEENTVLNIAAPAVFQRLNKSPLLSSPSYNHLQLLDAITMYMTKYHVWLTKFQTEKYDALHFNPHSKGFLGATVKSLYNSITRYFNPAILQVTPDAKFVTIPPPPAGMRRSSTMQQYINNYRAYSSRHAFDILRAYELHFFQGAPLPAGMEGMMTRGKFDAVIKQLETFHERITGHSLGSYAALNMAEFNPDKKDPVENLMQIYKHAFMM